MTWNPDDESVSPDPVPDGELPSSQRAAHTFLVRLWKETRADAKDKPVWRGTLSDLRGRQLGSFSSAAELVGILGELSAPDLLLRVSCVERQQTSADAR